MPKVCGLENEGRGKGEENEGRGKGEENEGRGKGEEKYDLRQSTGNVSFRIDAHSMRQGL